MRFIRPGAGYVLAGNPPKDQQGKISIMWTMNKGGMYTDFNYKTCLENSEYSLISLNQMCVWLT